MIERRGNRLFIPNTIVPAGGGGTFSPKDISGLVGWWDFSDVSTLWTDSVGATQVTADGDVIGAVNDKSSANNDLTQGTTSLKPLYKTGIKNGHSIGRGDATDDFLVMPKEVIQNESAFTVFVVVDAASGSTRTDFLGLWDTANSERQLIFRWETGNTLRLVGFGTTGFSDITSSGTYTTTNWQLVYSKGPVSTTAQLFVNGAEPLYSVQDVIASWLASITNDGAVGGYLDDGAGNFESDIGEIIFYNSTLSATQANKVRAYIDAKWGLP